MAHKRALEREYSDKLEQFKCQYEQSRAARDDTAEVIAQHKRAVERDCDARLRERQKIMEDEFEARFERVRAQERAQERASREESVNCSAEFESQKKALEAEWSARLDAKQKEVDALRAKLLEVEDVFQRHKKVVEEESRAHLQRHRRETETRSIEQLEERKRTLESDMERRACQNMAKLRMEVDGEKERMKKEHEQEVNRLRNSLAQQQQFEKTCLSQVDQARKTLQEMEKQLNIEREASGKAKKDHAKVVGIYEKKWARHQAEMADVLEQDKLKLIESHAAARAEVSNIRTT